MEIKKRNLRLTFLLLLIVFGSLIQLIPLTKAGSTSCPLDAKYEDSMIADADGFPIVTPRPNGSYQEFDDGCIFFCGTGWYMSQCYSINGLYW